MRPGWTGPRMSAGSLRAQSIRAWRRENAADYGGAVPER
jgi:hypothetical protein